jgi:phage gp36-like protein
MATAYLPVAEYKTRFGLQEAIRLTSEVQPPAVDDTKIEAAIIDAEEIVEGYVSRRYPLPLPEVPKVLKTWVATLARENLHKTRPTQEVKDAADRTRVQLREVAQGLFKLLVDDGSEATTAGGEQLSLTSGDRADETFTREAMGRYQDLGAGGYDPCWRRP